VGAHSRRALTKWDKLGPPRKEERINGFNESIEYILGKKHSFVFHRNKF
jgi:hypothetical protein